MGVVRIILTVVFMIVCVAMTVVILMQESKQQGLGSLGGMSETYWSKNKGRSREGMLIKITTVLVTLFLVISAVLCIGSI